MRTLLRIFLLGAAAATLPVATGIASTRRGELARPADTSPGKSGPRTQDIRRAESPADPSSGPPARGSTPGPLRIADAALEPAGWDELDGWRGDDHASAFATFQASCRPIVRAKYSNDERP